VSQEGKLQSVRKECSTKQL